MLIRTTEFAVDRAQFGRFIMKLYRTLIVVQATIVAALGIFALCTPLSRRPEGQLIGLLLVLGGPLLIYLTYVLWIRRFVNHPENRLLFVPRTMTFTDEGLASEGASGGTGNIPWDHILKVDSFENLFVLKVARTMFVFVPATAFANPAELAEFERFLLSKFPRSEFASDFGKANPRR